MKKNFRRGNRCGVSSEREAYCRTNMVSEGPIEEVSIDTRMIIERLSIENLRLAIGWLEEASRNMDDFVEHDH